MKIPSINSITLVVILVCLFLIDILATSLYWQHEAVIHRGAFFEANSWGLVSFKWNDTSFAQTPFQDPTPYEKINRDIFQKKLDNLGVK
jgi:hypothetical protein